MNDPTPAPKSGRAPGTGAYTPRERIELLRQVAGGAPGPVCPRCGSSCAVIRTGPRSDVSYVRDRVVVRCAGCRRSVVGEAGEMEHR
ncbi:MAG: hypothetical protein OXQ94_12225 [Gemmatimonadota bacterium]|nr:hypothetical protein [Gemmatimonadota bacterium]MDE2872437.1 hypothetical protein [Gemmatimonadota bacterium]